MKLLFIFLEIVLVFQIVAISSGEPGRCDNVPPTPAFPNCAVDLTVAVDMSSAMKTKTNFAILVEDLLNNTLRLYDIYNSHTSLIVFGSKEIQSTDYFDNFAEVCYHLTAAEAQAVEFGLMNESLSEVYTTFRDDQLPTGRKLKKVFLVLTAITDSDNVGSAVKIFNQIQSQGAYVILVSLNNAKQLGNMSRIADQVIYTLDYTTGDPNSVINTTCQFSGVTVGPTQQLTTSSPDANPLSNAMGTPCSINSTNAWLDLYFVIDVSKGMIDTDLLALSAQLATLFEGLTIGQIPKHTSRVGIITYASTATVQLNLTFCNSDNLIDIVFDLQNYRLPHDSGTNIKAGLEIAYNLTQIERSYRRTIVIVIAASYDPDDAEDPTQVAELIKQDGTAIFTVAFASSGTFNTQLGNLSTPGYSYVNTDTQLFDKMLFGFTQINCYCPPKTYQFQVYNDAWRNFTVFADCLYSSGGASIDPQFAERTCAGIGAVLATVTKERKLDFIIDNVINDTKITQFTVGAHLVNDQWLWYGYNGTTYPVGDYPKIPSGSSGTYGYFNNTFGFNWDYQTQNPKDKAKPYVCQSKACDADFVCNVDAHTFKKL
uniref:VWFA domain-containing protein n=1 Tax=Panagrolaimus sp. JU765 TaxID=591449 RepID=A0AC34RFF0_9BILA